MDRRSFLAAGAASAVALVTRVAPVAVTPPARRVLTLVYDRSIGAMRAIDRLVP